MPNIFDGFLSQIARGDTIKDYKHASRLFVDSNYALAPKYNWLFHVYFDLNPVLTTMNQVRTIEAGMLVKSADLPKFRVDTKTYNNYNRPSIAQSKTRFEDISISFYDDSSDVVRQLWYDYYNYYYRDMDNNYGDSTGSLNPVYQAPNKHVTGRRTQFNKFGYSPKSFQYSNQYIQAIRIYSLHQKRFSEYTLINPIITSYHHGTHNVSQDGTLDNTMRVSYETVLYASGAAKIARGFADLHYDKAPSPLTPAGGGTNSILGPGGIVNAADDVIRMGSNGNYGAAAFTLLRSVQQNKNVDLVNLAKGELTQTLLNAARGQNALANTYIPYAGVNADSNSVFQSALNTQTTAAVGSVKSNGFNITATAAAVTGGIASALAGPAMTAATRGISGLVTNAQGIVQGADINKLITVAKTSTGAIAAQASAAFPSFSFTGAIQAANDRIKALAATTAPTNTAVTFQSGTNNIVQQATNAFAQTPFKDLNFAATSEVSNFLGSASLAAESIAKYAGNTSTNPTQT